jgi:uncharacterized protein
VRDDIAEAFRSDPDRIQSCACGCERLVVVTRQGRPRRFATAACREAARRRRRAGLPEDFPRRTQSHGRMPFRRQPLTLIELRRQRDRILELARRRGVSNVRVFGSVARGDASLTSDVDLLLDMDPERSMLDLGGFAIEVSELLESRVDVVETETLAGRLRERVLEEAVSL